MAPKRSVILHRGPLGEEFHPEAFHWDFWKVPVKLSSDREVGFMVAFPNRFVRT